jgi:hypothetical protein
VIVDPGRIVVDLPVDLAAGVTAFALFSRRPS